MVAVFVGIFKQLVRRLTFLFLSLVVKIILIAMVLVTNKEQPIIEKLDILDETVLEWDSQKLIFENPG